MLRNFKSACLCHFKKKEKGYVLSAGCWKGGGFRAFVFGTENGCRRPAGSAIISLAVIFSVDLGCSGHNKGKKKRIKYEPEIGVEFIVKVWKRLAFYLPR